MTRWWTFIASVAFGWCAFAPLRAAEPQSPAPAARAAKAGEGLQTRGERPEGLALAPERLYVRFGGAVLVRSLLPGVSSPEQVEVALISGDGATTLMKARLPPGRADLAEVFPSFWEMDPPALRYAQVLVAGRPTGAPLVVEPLLTRPGHLDGWTVQILAAFERSDVEALRALMSLSDGARSGLRSEAHERVPLGLSAPTPVWSGVRVYTDSRVVLGTSAGEIELELRADAAPATAHRFLTLARDGFYDQSSFHRVIAQDARGFPFLVQAGDPTGTGAGGAGERLAFEPSTLAHDFGVVSMARQPGDPNSGSGQFFICLSREGCASLDGKYTSFARVVRGADVVRTIAAAPVGPSRPGDPRSPIDRPLELVVIERVELRPAPPIDRSEPAPPEPERVER